MGDKGPLLLRDFLIWRFDALERELQVIRGLLDRMAEKPVSEREFDSLRLQIAGLAEGLRELEIRVEQLEQHKSMALWLAGQIIVIVLIVAAIYLLEVLR